MYKLETPKLKGKFTINDRFMHTRGSMCQKFVGVAYRERVGRLVYFLARRCKPKGRAMIRPRSTGKKRIESLSNIFKHVFVRFP